MNSQDNNNDFIKINNFNLSYGNVSLFSDFSFSVPLGKCGGLFGPTGTGKTSLLNKIVDDYISKYKIAYIFQDNKLIEKLTVIKNVMIPLENLMGKKEAEYKSKKILKLVNLEEKAEEKVRVLSGGERQRVNIARAFAFVEYGKAEILLMDEPFSAQDEENREELIKLTKKIFSEKKVTSVLVSHNHNDMERLCNFVAYL